MTRLEVPGDMDRKLQRKWEEAPVGRLGMGEGLTSGPRPKNTRDRQFPWQISHPYFFLVCWFIWYLLTTQPSTNLPHGLERGSIELVRDMAVISDCLCGTGQVS